LGTEVLSSSRSLIIEEHKTNSKCHEALMKMTHCPKCDGLSHAKPCGGYCLNVMRGCLTKYVAELDSPWNGYVEGVERLVTAMKQTNNEDGVNVDAVLRSLEGRISDAIMYIMNYKQAISTKVKRACGVLEKEPSTPASAKAAMINLEQQHQFQQKNLRLIRPQAPAMPENALITFLTSIAKTRGFYSNLADNLCQDESYAEQSDQNCWNGERIADYTKTVVDASLDMQKYNPEVTHPAGDIVDERVASLADKLRHTHQLVMSSLGTIGSLHSDSYMQGDGADGSGSGDFPDDDDDLKPGSGSGDGPYNTNSIERTNNDIVEDNKDESGGTVVIKSTILPMILLILPFIRVYY